MRTRHLSRRKILGGLAAAGLAAVVYASRSYVGAREAALGRIEGRSAVISTRSGPLEFAEAGTGAPILMIHGTGGGFDQGLLFGEALMTRGHRIIAPSRFGYLRSSFPEDPSAGKQADALVELLDHLAIDQLPVLGGSAGALPAAAFALRHPDRCAALILLVPAGNLDDRDPVEMGPLLQWSVRRLLDSDLLFWATQRSAPRQLIRTLLATDPRLLDTVSVSERHRAYRILEALMPVSRRSRGMLNDALMAGAPTDIDFTQVRAPTLILSVEDDRFGTARTARLIATRIPDAALRLYPTGGHIWLGHDDDVADDVARFVGALARDTSVIRPVAGPARPGTAPPVAAR
jgi:pimeloyl-ACP methyl ester carboxylesterase